MTDDDLTAMARECGAKWFYGTEQAPKVVSMDVDDVLYRFAAAIAEQCAGIVMAEGNDRCLRWAAEGIRAQFPKEPSP